MHSTTRFQLAALIAVFAVFVFVCPAAGEDEKSSRTKETEYYYTVQKGDTLWGICKKFFDNPLLWPQLWSKNKQIANPHLIYPGNQLHLYEKDGKIIVEEVRAMPAKKPLPEEKMPVMPPAKGVPPALVQAKGPAMFNFPWMDQVGFIRDEALTPDAEIIKVKGDKIFISVGDTVYVKQTGAGKPALTTGALYAVYRTLEEEVIDRTTGKPVGIQHVLAGIVEITEMIDAAAAVAEAKVVKGFQQILLKDKIMPYKRLPVEIPLTESVKNLDGNILITERHENIFAQTIAFINVGQNAGVKPGQEYGIYYNEKLDPVTKKIFVGKLMVLRTEATTATTVVTDYKRDLEPGFGVTAIQQ